MAFKDYYESNFNLPNMPRLTEHHIRLDVYIPVLDDPISPSEVQEQVKLIK